MPDNGHDKNQTTTLTHFQFHCYPRTSILTVIFSNTNLLLLDTCRVQLHLLCTAAQFFSIFPWETLSVPASIHRTPFPQQLLSRGQHGKPAPWLAHVPCRPSDLSSGLRVGAGPGSPMREATSLEPQAPCSSLLLPIEHSDSSSLPGLCISLPLARPTPDDLFGSISHFSWSVVCSSPVSLLVVSLGAVWSGRLFPPAFRSFFHHPVSSTAVWIAALNGQKGSSQSSTWSHSSGTSTSFEEASRTHLQ